MTSFLRKCKMLYDPVLKGYRSQISCVRCQSQTLQHDMDRSSMTILNEETSGGLLINSYSRVGFRLNNGMMAFGPIAIFPKSILSWNVQSAEDINEDSLSLFYTLEPKIDILVIGIGDPDQKVSHNIIKYMKDKKINLEISTTERACATFNFLNVEGRCVAGALIPPTKYRINEDDIVSTQRQNRKLMAVDEYQII